MYVGRFVVVGPDVAAYRVSSRSFPNRAIRERTSEDESNDDSERTLTVGPTADAPETDNPYVAYNCLRVVETAGGKAAVVGNGSHVDPVAEKLVLGYPARDALAEALLALDYEKDAYDTPRIAGVLGPGEGGDGTGGDVTGGDGTDGGETDSRGSVGVVRRDALLVREVSEPTLVATYERDSPEPFAFEASTAEEAARAAYDLDFEHPVCAAAVTRDGEGGFETGFHNGG